MGGAINIGYSNVSCSSREAGDACKEYNVALDTKASQAVFRRNVWKSLSIAPVDTSGFVYIQGKPYADLLGSVKLKNSSLTRHLLTAYAVWWQFWEFWPHVKLDSYDTNRNSSSVLFDVQPPMMVFLSKTREHPQLEDVLDMSTKNLVVTDDGHTVENQSDGVPVNIAMAWQPFGLKVIEHELVQSLLRR